MLDLRVSWFEQRYKREATKNLLFVFYVEKCPMNALKPIRKSWSYLH